MSRTTYSGGRREQAARTWVITRDHGICWLCNHPGANSLDHIHPVTTHPHLAWEPTNWKAAHLTRAHTPTGCTHPGCTCIGNKARKATPITPPPSRTW